MSSFMNDRPINSLGFAKSPRETRVVVAMSGGVDSSVAAALLAEQEYDVVGVTLQLYDNGEACASSRTCCAGDDIYDARRVAESLGIPHYVLNYESKFRQEVIENFADSYIHGETPIPCVRCNQTVKFRDLLKTARDLGADALATGHYVRRAIGQSGPELWCADDLSRDQSYFLFATTRPQLDYLRFPLGDMDKETTRGLARRFRLPVSEKPDSQDICFVPDGDYASLVARLRPGADQPGETVHVDGRVLGAHKGIIHYTVGQRRGLGIGGIKEDAGDSGPLYVVAVEPETRRVVVGPLDALKRNSLAVHGLNWLGEGAAPPPQGRKVTVKLRSAQLPVGASVFGPVEGGDSASTGGRVRVELDAPEAGIAPGQACVFYDQGRLLGGGWICRDEAAA